MELQPNTLPYISALVDFICTIVFKDEVYATSLETKESLIASSAYLSACLKTDNNTDDIRQAIIDNYIELNPYYDNLWKKYNINPYKSRLAKDFDILYQDSSLIAENPYLDGYSTIYKQCREYFYLTGYAKSMESLDNYRNFCKLTINFMALTNFMAKWLKNPYDIDLMSEEMIDKFTMSFGINYFKKLPLQYKRKIAKNLNKLITNKGTDKVIIDILDLFNFSNIEVFKYFLARDELLEVRDSNNNLVKTVISNPRFISHNIKDKSLSTSIKAGTHKVINIDEATVSDPRWQINTSEIASKSFDYVQTKYFSTNSGFELYKEGLGTAFLYNLIYKIRNSFPSAEKLETYSTSISTNPIRIEDLILTLQILTLDYYNIEDQIQFDLENIANIYNFTNKDDNSLNTKIFGNEVSNWTLKDLTSVRLFDISTLVNIYDANFSIHNKFKNKMYRTTSVQEFKDLRVLYKSKFISKLNLDLFKGFSTYTNYIQIKNKDLYDYILSSRNISNESERRSLQEKQITLIIDVLTDYLNGIELYFSSTTLDILSSYLKEVIEVFKSFTVTVKDLDVFIITREFGDQKVLDQLKYTKARTYIPIDRIPYLYVKIKKSTKKYKIRDVSFINDELRNKIYRYKNSTYLDLTNSTLSNRISVTSDNYVNRISDNTYITEVNSQKPVYSTDGTVLGRIGSLDQNINILNFSNGEDGLTNWSTAYSTLELSGKYWNGIQGLNVIKTRDNSGPDRIGINFIPNFKYNINDTFLVTVIYEDNVGIRIGYTNTTRYTSSTFRNDGSLVGNANPNISLVSLTKFDGKYKGVFSVKITDSSSDSTTYTIISIGSYSPNIGDKITLYFVQCTPIELNNGYTNTFLANSNRTSIASTQPVNMYVRRYTGSTSMDINYSDNSVQTLQLSDHSIENVRLPNPTYDIYTKYLKSLQFYFDYSANNISSQNEGIKFIRNTKAFLNDGSGTLKLFDVNQPKTFNNGIHLEQGSINYIIEPNSIKASDITDGNIVDNSTLLNPIGDIATVVSLNNTGNIYKSSNLLQANKIIVFSGFVHYPTLVANNNTVLTIWSRYLSNNSMLDFKNRNYINRNGRIIDFGFIDYPNGWVRFWYSYNNTIDSTNFIRIAPQYSTANNYTATLSVFGLQIEENKLSSYIGFDNNVRDTDIITTNCELSKGTIYYKVAADFNTTPTHNFKVFDSNQELKNIVNSIKDCVLYKVKIYDTILSQSEMIPPT